MPPDSPTPPSTPPTRPGAGLWIVLGGLVLFAGGILFALYHFVLGPGLMRNVVHQRHARAQSEILELEAALEACSARQLGRYPDSLAALLAPDENGRTLLPGRFELPRDPWGREYVYTAPTPGHARPTLLSLGRDGRPGGAGEDADVDRRGARDAAASERP